MSDLFDRAAKFFQQLQTDICRALADADSQNQFSSDTWERPGGGGGISRVLADGAVFEKAGVNWSNVDGELPADLAEQMPGTGRNFRASGVSLVLHPRSPMIPTTHANFRCLTKGDALWFGGVVLTTFTDLHATYTTTGLTLDRLTPVQRLILAHLDIPLPWPETHTTPTTPNNRTP